jgi:hypothetical protein
MQGLLYPALAVIAWAAVAYRMAVRRRGAMSAAQYAVVSAIALLAVTFTVSTPAIWRFLDRVTGVDNIAALIAHLCVVGFSGTVQLLLIWWASPPDVARRRARPRLVFLGAVVGVLLVLFVAAGPTQSRPTDFVATYVHRPLFAAYLLAYLAAFGVGLVDIVRLCWPYARLVDRVSLRRGLRTTAAGSVLGLVYCLLRGADVAGAAAGVDVSLWEAGIPLSASLGALLVIAGLTMPTWAPRMSGVAYRQRLHRQLHPLWTALVEAVPEVRLSPQWKQRLTQGPDARLHRRVVEIYDARLALRPYLDERVGREVRERGEAAGLDGADLDAAVEAAKLRTALAARRAGQVPEEPERPANAGTTAVDEAAEIEWLARVSAAFAATPRA